MKFLAQGSVRNRDRRKKPDRKTNRSWQLIFDLPSARGDRRRQKRVSFRGTEEEAHVRLAELLVDARRGNIPGDRSVSVAEYFTWWFRHRRTSARVRKRHIDDQERLIELHVLPCLGSKRLADLTTRNLQELYDDLLRSGRIKRRKGDPEGLSDGSVHHVHRAVFAALRTARDMEFVPNNVAERVRAPSPRAAREYRVLSLREAALLVQAALHTRLFLVIFIAVVTGLRRSEILALRWRDIDLQLTQLTVAKSLQRDCSLENPKSKRSKRTLWLPSELVELLQARRPTGYTPDGQVFCDDRGAPWKPDSIGTLYRRIVRDSGIEYVQFKELRHSAASIMIALGVPLPTVSRILGHANTAITGGIYAQAIRELDEHARAVMADNAREIAGFLRSRLNGEPSTSAEPARAGTSPESGEFVRNQAPLPTNGLPLAGLLAWEADRLR